ncbi:MAG: glycosyltransferase family 4 protein [Myxococcota bacterium]
MVGHSLTPKRVVVACADPGVPLYGPSGASAHLRGIARALSAVGHDVQVACARADDARGRWDDAPPIPARHPGGLRWPPGLRSFGVRVEGWALAASAASHRPDRLWERHEPRSRAFGRWAAWTGVERWVELNAPLSIERRWPQSPRPREAAREREALRSADRVLAVSRWLADWAVDQGCAPERVVHLPNGVEPQGPGDRQRARASLGWDGPVLGFLGSGRPWHGVDRLPALLDALGPTWAAVVIGGGPAPTHPRLRALGHRPQAELPGWVSAFDVGIAPYRADAPRWFCPLKLLAYRAQGVPVVAPDLGDCRALMGDAGRTPASDRPEAWAEAIEAARGLPRTRWVRSWVDVALQAELTPEGAGAPSARTS